MSQQQQIAHSAHSKASRLTFRATGQASECRTKYTYDPNGNLAAVGSVTNYAYFYDDENRLIQWFHYANGIANVSNGDLRTDFTYDGVSRLRKRLEYSWSSGGASPQGGPLSPGSWQLSSETHYIYDGSRVAQERDGSNNPTVSYTRGADLSGSLEGAGGIGGLLARSSGYSSSTGNWSTHYFFHADGNGNITYLVDSSRNLAASYRYDPFGNTISSSGTVAAANVYRFSSKEIHASSGTYYYLYRFYDPNLQRWINRDPLGEAGINLYRLGKNDPPNGIDADGRFWKEIGAAVGAVSGTIIAGGLSLVVDAYSGGGNIPATPAELGAGAACYGAIGAGLGAGIDSLLATRSTLPAREGPPNGALTEEDGQGNGKIREYDSNGNAKKDFDFGHHHGVGDPHAHDWDWNLNPPRQPGRPLAPGE
jgi:RHS repeat-associated protein